MKGWLADLQDWCITRDAPYFGFPVKDPDFPGKFLYVWLDAPIGYLSSGEHYFAAEAPAARRLTPADLPGPVPGRGGAGAGWSTSSARTSSASTPSSGRPCSGRPGVKRPDRMVVHGHLTVNGEKMSKSRGTFINASTYLESGLDPELLRYFFAANLGAGVSDLDLSLEEFRNRINADLANNVANLASRVAALVERGGGVIEPSREPPGGAAAGIQAATLTALGAARQRYLELQLREVVRQVSEVAEPVQQADPGREALGGADRPTARGRSSGTSARRWWPSRSCSSPIMPRFAAALAEAFGDAAAALGRRRSIPSTARCAWSASRRRSPGSTRRRWRS